MYYGLFSQLIFCKLLAFTHLKYITQLFAYEKRRNNIKFKKLQTISFVIDMYSNAVKSAKFIKRAY